jgi:poly-beta-1,6-N-acetyl-D-glucosamine synthase
VRFLFWASALFVVYTYLGYVGLVWMLSRVRPRPIKKSAIQPPVSIIMAVHNGADVLPAKVANLSELAYPGHLVEIVVASDGSTDATNEILNPANQVKSVICPRVGKAEALNRAVAVSSHEILVFTDARQRIEPDAISELVANFADDDVGCVSGELMFRRPGENSVSGISTYWRFEKLIRKSESASGSVMGVTGALYALRRSLFAPMPTGTLLDDVYVPLQVLGQGKRVAFEPKAQVWDTVTQEPRSEFSRKVRTLAGNLQIVELMPSLLIDRRMSFRFISHKLTRLLAPWLLVVLFCSSWLLSGSPFYRTLAMLQTAFYALGLVSALMPSLTFKLTSAIQAFCLMNAAALAAPFSYLRHRSDPKKIWTNWSVPIAKPESLPTIRGGSANTSR